MGLTVDSTGLKSIDLGLQIKKTSKNDKSSMDAKSYKYDFVIALAGNPNVGKSTVFNELTGMKQHTGNWPGKTVANAQGIATYNNHNYILVDIPGTYSLMANSQEEEIARDYICFGNSECVIVVCDGTILERNMNLVLQTLEITNNVVVCVNLMDEVKKKKITIDLDKISKRLGVPVIGTTARSKCGLTDLMAAVEKITSEQYSQNTFKVSYTDEIENAINIVLPLIDRIVSTNHINPRWVTLKLLEQNEALIKSIGHYIEYNLFDDNEVALTVQEALKYLKSKGINQEKFKDLIVSNLVLSAEKICYGAITFENKKYNEKDRKIDRILTSKSTGIPIMLLLLAIIFWLTLSGANLPSKLISNGLFWLESKLLDLCMWIKIPPIIYEPIIFGIYRVLAWVVSVMLPPMAIFFPLFTLLEDLGYLPRVAFNLDKPFKKCSSCGKQALTMCMGFGCNAAGIVGCRIINSPRERLIAILTNNFVPCNGRFPTLIAIITMFFVFNIPSPFQSIVGALILTLVVLFGIFATFLISKILSKTALKGESSSFTLELPPYRRPQIGKIIIRSIFDRTLFVLGRAISIAAPAGLIIWLFANITINNNSLLSITCNFLEPLGKLIGLDGVILFAFILGFPANEIVIPIIIMAYMSNGHLIQMENLFELKQLLVVNGWTWITAACMMIFSLMHWPCSTTLLTIKKETKSIKWTVLAFLIPTVCGLIMCFLFSNIAKLLI